MTITDETTGTTTARAWYPSDYARFAAACRRASHVQCQPYTPASLVKRQAVAMLAGYIGETFAADAPEGSFDLDAFLRDCAVPGQHPDTWTEPADEPELGGEG